MGFQQAHDNLAGKVAVIVGGAAGIGRAIALTLADASVAIALCDNDQEAIDAIVPELKARGVDHLAMLADVCDVPALDAFFDAVDARFGKAFVLVNVAGGSKRNFLTDATREDDAEQIRKNYGYVIDTFRRGIDLMRKGGEGGSIVSFTTIEAHRGAATYSVYAGAKAATMNFSKSMALELGAEGIRVNTIAPDTSPSYTRTKRNPAEATMIGRNPVFDIYIPQKQAPSEQDLANTVLFLASDLSRAITGMTFHVDGGTMASGGFMDWPNGDGWGPIFRGGTAAKLFG